MFKEIGSNFWSLPKGKYDRKKFWWEDSNRNVDFFKSGRNAIKAIAKSLDNTNKSVLIPFYTCETVISPFIDENWNVYYYDINEDMSINNENLLKLVDAIKPTLVYVHSYFGFNTLETSLDTLKSIQSKGVLIVEDITQSLFSSHYLEFADYYVSSLRKFFAIPEGGVVISKNKLPIVDVHKENEKITELALEAFNVKEEYTQVMDDAVKQKYRKMYGDLNVLINENDVLQRIGKTSYEIFQNVNSEEIISKRIINYNYLYDLICDNERIIPIFDKLKDGEVPLYFPLYVKDENRKYIQSRFAENEIYCPVIWPKSKLITGETEHSKYMYNHMLCIPIDQRYDQKDMDRIFEVLKNI